MTNNKKGLEDGNNHGSQFRQGSMHSIKKETSTRGMRYFETYEEANQELDQPTPAANPDEPGNKSRKEKSNRNSGYVKNQDSNHNKGAKPPSANGEKTGSNKNQGSGNGI